MYDRGKLCDIIDDHSTDIDVRKLQQSLRSHYPQERGFRDYDGLRGPTKWHRIDHLLEILETHTADACSAVLEVMLQIRPEDQQLRTKLNSECGASNGFDTPPVQLDNNGVELTARAEAALRASSSNVPYMSVDPANPPIAAIRELMAAAFTPQTLRRFCQDHPTFRLVVSHFGPKYSLDDMVDEVVTFCNTQLLWGELLTGIESANPRQYARFALDLAGQPETIQPGSYDRRVLGPAERLDAVRAATEMAKQATSTERYSDISMRVHSDGHMRVSSDEGQRETQILLSIPDDIALTIDLIENNKTTETLLKQFGRRLYHILFPASIDKHFSQTEAAARKDRLQVRIRLTIEPDALAQLPWEFTYREEGDYFLATNPGTVLSHYLDLPLPSGYVRKGAGPLHMLTIISSPNDQSPLDVNHWERIVRKALSPVMKQGLLTLKIVKQATFEKIRDALLDRPPDIVQFIGHGVYHDGKGYLALVDEAGGTWKVDDERFAAIFAGVLDCLGLVSLATCESAKSDSPKSFLGIAPRIVQRGVPAVVAMRYPVLVSTAEIFLDNFYTALAARKPVDWAVQSARNAIAIKVGMGNREFATPVLFMRAKDGNIF